MSKTKHEISEFKVGQTVWWVCDGWIDDGHGEEEHAYDILYKGTILKIEGNEITTSTELHTRETEESKKYRKENPEYLDEVVGTPDSTFATPEEAIEDAVDIFRKNMFRQLDAYKAQGRA